MTGADALLWRLAADVARDAAVYAVVDGAADPRLVARVRESGCAHECLFKADLPAALEEAAPYVVLLVPGHPLGEWLLTEGAGRAWGVFLVAGVGLKALAKHLRRYVEVQTEDGRTMLFRFYDPRVLDVYLPTCTREEHAFVFGPVAAFFTEREGQAGLVEHRWRDGAYAERRHGAPAAADTRPLPEVLAGRYPTVDAIRRLWQAAGGDPGQVPERDAAAVRWGALLGGSGPVLGLLRCALADAPADPTLLAALARRAREEQPAAVEAAAPLVALWETKGAEVPVGAVREALETFPARSRDVTFAALAPQLQGRLGATVRAALRVRLAALRLTEEAGGEVEALLERLRDPAADAAVAGARVGEVLRGILARIEASPARGEPELTKLAEAVTSRLTSLTQRQASSPRVLAASLASLRVTLGLTRRRPLDSAQLAALAAGAEDGLALTAGA